MSASPQDLTPVWPQCIFVGSFPFFLTPLPCRRKREKKQWHIQQKLSLSSFKTNLHHIWYFLLFWCFPATLRCFTRALNSAPSDLETHCTGLQLTMPTEDPRAAELITEVTGCRLGQIYFHKMGRHICSPCLTVYHRKPHANFLKVFPYEVEQRELYFAHFWNI